MITPFTLFVHVFVEVDPIPATDGEVISWVIVTLVLEVPQPLELSVKT